MGRVEDAGYGDPEGEKEIGECAGWMGVGAGVVKEKGTHRGVVVNSSGRGNKILEYRSGGDIDFK